MGSKEIKIREEKVRECIQKMEQLSEKCQKMYNKKSGYSFDNELISKGATADELEKIMYSYNDIRKNLVRLFDTTKEFFENALDGYVDEDESAATKMYKILREDYIEDKKDN